MRTKRRRRRSRRQRIRTRKLLISGTAVLVIAGLVFGGFMLLKNILPAAGEKTEEPKTPEELLCYYMAEIEQDKYEEMYDMLEPQSQESISREAFAERNRNIYQGIDAAEIRVEVTQVQESGSQAATVFYDTSMNTSAGEISFSNKVVFLKNQLEKGEEGYPYLLVWDDSLIFPELTATDKVKVTRDDAARGEIVDRSGRMLAGKGVGSSVGLVPGKMEKNEESDDIFGEETVTDEEPAGNEETPVNEETAANESSDVNEETSSKGTEASTETNTETEPEKISSPSVVRLAELLEVSPESIEKKLSAKWVKDDSFVPIKTIQKLTDQELMSDNPGEEVQKKKELQEALLAIPGVLITDVEIRDYPLGKAASHLTGYIQQVTAEDLEKHPGEGYRANSVIGRSGMELLYEKELKGQDGCEIAILNDAGQKKSVLAQIPKRDGQTIQLTIDAGLQKELYDTYAEDKSCSVAMDPFTGEVLALVSTPSFDSRDFIYGMSQTLWDSLNEDERMPLYNRFRQKLCPGSSFKPVIAAIGLETGAIDPDMDYGNEGLQWQKDASWGKVLRHHPSRIRSRYSGKCPDLFRQYLFRQSRPPYRQ